MRSLLAILSVFSAAMLSAVTLDPLIPGKEFKSLTVSGAADAAVVIKLIDRTEVVTPMERTASVVAGRFSEVFSSLEPGHEYAVLIDDVEKETVVMSREMTDGWISENARTYEGLELGTGVWGGQGECAISDGRIVIEAEVNQDHEFGVVFLPTNRFGAASGYWVRANLTFEGEAQAPRMTDGIFGVTLVIDPNDNSRAVFYIIDGQTWKRTETVGNIAVAYDMEFFVDELTRRVGYYLVEEDRRVYLGAGKIPAGVPTRFRAVDFQGFGSIKEIVGEGRDCSLIASEVHIDGDFSNGVLRAGMNFTNLVLNGWVSITNLWDTDMTSGLIEVRIVGADGHIRLAVTNEWNGFGGVYGITNMVDGLTQGETYTVEVNVLDNTGQSVLGDGDWASKGIMGRVTDAWYDEDGYSISGRVPYTGIWEVEQGISLSVDDAGVVIVASDGTVEGAKAVFTPTNSVPRNGRTCVNSFEAIFVSAMDFGMLPDATEELFGITLAEDGGDVKLAVIIDGEWVLVDTSVYRAELGRLYTIDAVCAQTENGASIEYFVTDEAGVMKSVARGVFRPGAKPYPSEVAFRGDGRFNSAVGMFYDTTLMNIELELDNMPGTNFTAVAVSGMIRVTPMWDTDCSNGTIRVEIKNGRGEVVSVMEIDFSGDSPIDISVDGLEPGESYSVSTFIINTNGPADGEVAEENVLTPTAKEYSGQWIFENARTFAGVDPRTGDWYYRERPIKEAKVVESSRIGQAILIDADLSSSVIFESTNVTAAIVNSTIREITFEICSETAGYVLSAPEFPKMRTADLAGVTIVCDDLADAEKLHFSVYNPAGGGSWSVLSNTVAELNRPYIFTVIITYPNPNKTTASSIGYYLENAAGKRERIAFFEPGKKANGSLAIPEINDSYRTRLRFTGGGLVKRFEGSCYDAHLAIIDGIEYWTIADAIREIGSSGRVFSPLWYSSYTVDVSDGWFGVYDPNHWLNLIWPLGYVVEITDRGEIRFYLFWVSDYWIDWAVKEDVVETPSGWDVKSANGLAWLAKMSTNEWITGDITLSTDITNLYEHIWTPIRGFTGTFDGNNRTITGLTDKGAGYCWTNSLDLSAYGLFGSASNSVFRNIALERVAITNIADAVGSLLGCSIGDLGLTNVVVRSGDITGGGRFVSGIVGYVGDFADVGIYKNLNAATVAITNAPLGGVNASGIANLGVNYDDVSSLSVISNENRGTIISTINSTIGGGNVAQILAGSDPDTHYNPVEDVKIIGNVGTGDVTRVESINHPAWSIRELPIVNLAAEVSRQSGEIIYKEFIEANDSTDVVIDPWRLTARMTGAFYQQGVTNFAGIINDQITASRPGDVVTVQDSGEIWSSIELDRAITLDLNGKVIDNVFDTYTFDVTVESGEALVKNGVVTHPTGKLATRPEGDGWRKQDVVTAPWDCNYWDRTLFIDGEFMSAASLPLMMSVLNSGSVISTPDDSAYSIDSESGALKINGKAFVSFSDLGYSVREVKDGGDTVYVVDIEDPLVAPEINLAIVPNGSSAKVVVNGAKVGFEYCLQSVESLAEAWDKSTDEWVTVSRDDDLLEFEVDTSKPSGFYRIKIREK